MRQKLYSLFKGSVQAFIAVNILFSITAYITYPHFFQIGLLFRPSFLMLTIPLSIAFHLNIKYLRKGFENREKQLPQELKEAITDADY